MLDEEGAPVQEPLMKGRAERPASSSTQRKRDEATEHLQRGRRTGNGTGIIEKDDLSEVVYRDGNVTLFSLDDGVEIILGKEDQTERLKRAVAVLDDAKKRGLLIKCIDARFENGAIVKERKG